MSLTLNTGSEVRAQCRKGDFTSPTAGHAPGFVQANLVIVPAAFAYDFLLFCQRNPKPCPILEVLDKGSPQTRLIAKDADLRTDLPKYRVYESDKIVDEPNNINKYWRDDLVSFLLGCSFTFDRALRENGIPVRHEDEGRNVPMYRTNIPCKSAGVFQGPLVVSMRPMTKDFASKASHITGRFPRAHGSPVHQGDPSQIGISNINRPDYGESVTIHPNEIPVFWACGVTPQAVAVASKIPFLITHSPGHMLFLIGLITNLKAKKKFAKNNYPHPSYSFI